MNADDQRVYDPLRNHGPGCGKDHVATYWAATAGQPPEDDGPIPADTTVEVAIIGGGYTGLSSAYHLARDHGIDAVVLEANRTGWGCSGRNGGSIRPTIGKLSLQRMIDKWGIDTARQAHNEGFAALTTFRGIAESSPVDCDLVTNGIIKIAHRPDRYDVLTEEARILREAFNHDSELVPPEEAQRRFMTSPEVHGALKYPEGLGVHPLKLVHGLQSMARTAGAKVHVGSEVINWSQDGGYHRLTTPSGNIRAKRVILATNGYTPERLHPLAQGRLLPVLSHIIVTRPLSEDERNALAIEQETPFIDTRNINQYFRIFKDGRLLLGSRGAANDSLASSMKQRRFLEGKLARKFPSLAGIDIEFDWNGWVCLTYDWIPHIGQAEDDPSLFYALGYGGGGIAFSLQAGKRLAERISGRHDTAPQIPTFTTPMPRFPMAAFRRLGQGIAIGWLQMKDNR